MARVNFDTAMATEAATTTSNNPNNSSDVGFLMLRNDGDEAIVRFMYDSTDEFDIHTVHTNVKIGERFREVNCLRNPLEPMDNCPFCQAQMPLQQKFVIKMTQYVIDNTTGQITPKPVVWERSIAYARTLRGYLDNYGPLTDILCKIIRHGRAGDQRTTYEIIPNLNKQIYRDDLYPKVPDIFGDYDPLGRLIYDKNAEEMNTYLQTGNFPLRNNRQGNQDAAGVTARTYTPAANEPQVSIPPRSNPTPFNAAPSYAASANQEPTYAPTVTPNAASQQTAPTYTQAPRQTLPWETPNSTTNAGGFERPVRRY